jgi:GntR family transcriptional regulator
VISDSYVPRYREIEQVLRARIADLKPGDPLPSDAALCREFGVSRMTARNAVGRLAEEGLITREPGRGSFVAVPQSHRRANNLLSFSDEMRRHGRVPRSRLLRRELRPARPDEVRDLRLGEGEPVVALVRIRLADDVPIALEAVALHGRCAAAVMHADLETGSLHETLRAAGFVPARGKATLAAGVAGAADADLLGVAPGTPLLVERRVIVDLRGRPLESTESRYPADRYALDVDFEVEGARDRAARGRDRG